MSYIKALLDFIVGMFVISLTGFTIVLAIGLFLSIVFCISLILVPFVSILVAGATAYDNYEIYSAAARQKRKQV